MSFCGTWGKRVLVVMAAAQIPPGQRRCLRGLRHGYDVRRESAMLDEQLRKDLEVFRFAAQEALRTGWATARLPSVGGALDRFEILCQIFGRPRPVRANPRAVEVLSPVSCTDARPRSLSALYGVEDFPPHTDCAHWTTPPRLLVLYCKRDEENRPTTLHDWDIVGNHLYQPRLVIREVFLVRRGRGSFYDSIASHNRAFIRFDLACMEPATSKSIDVVADVQRALRTAEAQTINWSPGTALFVDNWRVLHARGKAVHLATRVLYRALFTEVSLPEGGVV